MSRFVFFSDMVEFINNNNLIDQVVDGVEHSTTLEQAMRDNDDWSETFMAVINGKATMVLAMYDRGYAVVMDDDRNDQRITDLSVILYPISEVERVVENLAA